MTAEMRDWLLTSPELKRVSKILVDAAATGAFDLRETIANAVATKLGDNSVVPVPEVTDRALYGRLASYSARHPRRHASARIMGDTAVICGSLADGVGVSESRTTAAIHFNTRIPLTVVTSLRGRAIDEIVDTSNLPIGSYDISAAEQNDRGLTLWFNAPRVLLRQALDAGKVP